MDPFSADASKVIPAEVNFKNLAKHCWVELIEHFSFIYLLWDSDNILILNGRGWVVQGEGREICKPPGGAVDYSLNWTKNDLLRIKVRVLVEELYLSNFCKAQKIMNM